MMRTLRLGLGRTETFDPVAVGLALTLALVLAACASGGTAMAPAGQSSAASAGPAEAPADGFAAPSAPTSGVIGGGNSSVDGVSPTRDGARIVRTGSLQLEVEDVRKALRSARDTITGMGGYIGASQQSSDGDGIVATVSYRIPEARWEDALDAIRNLGNEVAEQTDAVEVTNQIVDLDARIRNLQASETALVRHAADAVKVSDLLEIEARLSDVRGQIEQLTAQKKNLEDQAAYSTLAVTFGTEVAAVQQAAEQWDPKGEVDRASASLIGVLEGLTTIGIWFVIVWLPILALLGILVAVALFVARRLGYLRRTVLPAGPTEG